MKCQSNLPRALIVVLATLTGLSGSYGLSVAQPLASHTQTTVYAAPQSAAQATPQPQPDSHYFPETKHTVAGKFWQYWQSHGGLAQQGYPISDQLQEKSDTDGKTYTVQYFERAVFEAHPEQKAPYDVLLSLLGTLLYNQKYAQGAPGQAVNKDPGSQRFPETGHTAGGLFLGYWKSHGGLAQQGFPISEEFTEVSPTDGKSYKVQYFERAVFEAHPEQKAPYNVLLSLLGTFRLQSQQTHTKGGVDEAAAAFAQGVTAYRAGDFDTAIAAFGTAIQNSPQFAQAFINRALAYIAKGNYTAAQTDLDQAAGIQPKDTTPLYLSGISQYKQGNYAEAVTAFGRELAVDANDQRGYYWRANAYLGQNDNASALQDFTDAARVKPDSDLGKLAQTAVDQLNAGTTVPAAQVPALDLAQGQPPAPPPPAPGGGNGTILADLGFRAATDGFAFENYGGAPDRSNLTPDDVRRMFGDPVCASTANGCILTPEAQAWMDKNNKDMNGGHCEGFAALSLIFYQRKQDPAAFGAPKTHDLTINNNTPLQREIAYYFATQGTRPASDNAAQKKAPAEVLDILTEAFKPGANAPKTYSMGIYKPGYKDGHAITPYAIEDRGNGQFAIKVYDNNFPDTEREVLVDRNANKWSYMGSTNPKEPGSLYEGDATTLTLDLTPTDTRLVKQICDFCPGGGGGGGLATGGVANTVYGFSSFYKLFQAPAQAPAQYNQVSLVGTGDLLLTDKQGHQTGYTTPDKLVNDIPGVLVKPITSANLWQNDLEPIYYVPTGVEFTLAIKSTDPTSTTESSVSMIGPGYDLAIDDLVLEPNTIDTVTFSPDGKMLVYKTEYSDSPDLVLGTHGANADFSFDLKGVDLGNNGAVSASLDKEKGRLVLDAKNNTEDATYSLTMDRIDTAGEQVFGHDQIGLKPGDTAYLNYEQWQGNGTPLLLEIDHGSDGTIDETIQLTDVH